MFPDNPLKADIRPNWTTYQRQVPRNVESDEVEPCNHVENRTAGLALFPKLLHHLVYVFLNTWRLIFDGLIAKGTHESSPIPSVVILVVSHDAEWLIRSGLLEPDRTSLDGRMAGTRGVDVLPSLRVDVGELIWSDPDYKAVLVVQVQEIAVQVSFFERYDPSQACSLPEQWAWVGSQGVQEDVVDESEGSVLPIFSSSTVNHGMRLVGNSPRWKHPAVAGTPCLCCLRNSSFALTEVVPFFCV